MATHQDFYSERIVCGRKAHRCTFCRVEIPKGERHAYISSCSGGTYHTHRAHLACQAAATGRAEPGSAPAQEAAT